MTSLGCFSVPGGSFSLTFTDVETRKGTKGDKKTWQKWRFFAKIGGLGQISPIALIFLM